MRQGKSKLLSLLVAVTVLASSTVMMVGATGETAKKTRYPVPDYDFSAGSEFLGNSNEKKPTWCSWRNVDEATKRPSRDDTILCQFGKSAKMIDESAVNTLFVDLYDDYALPAGDYILQAFAKTQNVVTDNEGATDQGLRLMATNWSTDDTGVDYASETYSANLTGTTDGWEIMEMPFTVKEGVSTVRIGAKMNNSTGIANITRFTIRPADQYFTIKNGGFEEFTNFASEFVTDAGMPSAPDGEKWGAWSTLVSLADIGHTGEHSLCIDLDKTGVVVNLKYGSLVKLTPGKDYEFSAWVKTENVVRRNADGTDMGAYIQVVFYKDKSTNGADAQDILWPSPDMKSPNALNGTQDWTQIVYRFTAPEGVTRALLAPSMTECTGKAYFDDIEFKEAAPLPSEPVVEKPDFDGVESFVRNDTPQGSNGDAIRYTWGAWYGKSTDGSPAEQSFTDAFSVSDTAPDGFTKSAKINAQSGTNYQIRQIIENLDGQMEYVLRAQVKTENLTGEGAVVGVAFLKEDKSVVWELDGKEVLSKTANGNTDWTDLYVKFTMPADTVDLFLYGTVRDSAGTAYFTDFELLPANFYEEPDNGNTGDDNTDGDKTDGDKTDGDKTDGDKTDNDKTDNDKTNNDNTDNDKPDVPKEDNEKTTASVFPVTVVVLLVLSAGALVFMKKKVNR